MPRAIDGSERLANGFSRPVWSRPADLEQNIILTPPFHPVVYAGRVPEEQLRRQRAWLGESWTWLLRTMVLDRQPSGSGRPTALDVGCGPGLVMELLSPFLDVRGIDADPEAVIASNARGQRASVARAEELPFEDRSFDIVYCSYLLLWVEDPVQVVREMARVARDWVICLAEPDHLGRITYPPELGVLDTMLADSLRRQGADPMMGRKLPGTFARCGLEATSGVHASMWSPERMREESEAEWRSLTASAGEPDLATIRKAWGAALSAGSLVQYNPVFYSIARKQQGQERLEQM